MGKEFIGKRIRLQIGGEPSKDDGDKIIGQDVSVHVPADEIGNYSCITGEKVELVLGRNVDDVVRDIMSAIERSAEVRKAEVVSICKDTLAERDAIAKAKDIATLVSIGSGIATIAQFILQLKSTVGL